MKYSSYLNKDKKLSIKEQMSILNLIIIIGGIFGFIYEYIFYYFNGGMKYFYWRGGNFLPWINIYALGGIIIYMLVFKDRKKPLKVFLKSLLICGILEYIAGLTIFIVTNGKRFWDYNTEILNFGNINGFICLRSVVFFGISGIILVYLILPFCYYIIEKFNTKKVFYITTILCSIFLIDELYNSVISIIFNLPRAIDIYKLIGLHFLSF